jgi:hypothetical protein
LAAGIIRLCSDERTMNQPVKARSAALRYSFAYSGICGTKCADPKPSRV